LDLRAVEAEYVEAEEQLEREEEERRLAALAALREEERLRAEEAVCIDV